MLQPMLHWLRPREAISSEADNGQNIQTLQLHFFPLATSGVSHATPFQNFQVAIVTDIATLCSYLFGDHCITVMNVLRMIVSCSMGEGLSQLLQKLKTVAGD